MERFVKRRAGLDVHRDHVTATVRGPRARGGRAQETRTFARSAAGLGALAAGAIAVLVA